MIKKTLNSLILILSALTLNSCSSTKTLDLKEFQNAFSEGPCKFGKMPLEKDPELPHAGYVPSVFCDENSEQYFVLGREWIDYDWSEVFYDGKGRFVAILDWAIEGGFAIVPVLESRDKGKTWQLISKIEKPHFSARVIKLVFDEDGNGEVHLEWEPKGIVVAKLYSKDNGKTWVTGSR